jgi:hypothetical protein
MSDYHCEIIEIATGRTMQIMVGDLNAITKKLLHYNFWPVSPKGAITDPWESRSFFAKFIKAEKNAAASTLWRV